MIDFTQGKNLTISKNVKIGSGSVLGNNITLHDNIEIGERVRIDDNVVIGKKPMKAVTSTTTENLSEDNRTGDTKDQNRITKIGKGTLIGTNAIIYTGCQIGEDCLIADSASVREDVTIGNKTIIGRNTTIENKVSIGSFCKIQSNVQIVPYSVIEDYVFLSPGVITSNDKYAGRTKRYKDEFKGVTIKKGARLGVASITLPGVVIGEDAMVGAGSVVTKDVPPKKVVYGVPAKVIRDVPKEQLLENQ